MEIIVVGAGIVGASTAYHLAAAGARVTLVDRADEGQATAAGAGIVCPWLSRGTDPARYRLASAGARYYPELVGRLNADGRSDTGYARTGALAVAGSAERVRESAERARRRRADEPEVGEVTVLDPGEARRLFPPLRDDWPAVHVTGAARVDGARLRDTMLAAAERRGTVRRSGSARVTVTEDGRWTVAVDGDAVPADAVVLAAGAWSAGVLASPATPLPVVPQRGQIVHLRLPGADTRRWPIVLPEGDHYMLAFDDSRIVVGATREHGTGFDHRVTAAGLREVLDEAISVAPGLADATVADIRVGFRPASLDERPLLGAVAGAPGLIVATGFGPTGLTMGPYAGAVAAELALGRTPELDLSPYDPSRVVEGRG
ncbi:NAD(P)/FAD-dependent oxidoreductase [Actinoallomurus iriomotensis]|uniref:Oxidoreductase YurR n=1 Tax=Actinoallomurus iriomotensis TaxID=478107 RepID=A0A9W6SDN2_9ACTN|nr:FAD-dependent oxidoreductase [Actinoallomurus iriomotensis]GLY90327.1 putative oxidoreductase YurR [Actinoallomurus iriomotensis]